MSKIEKRNFYLMMSAVEGQEFAAQMGFEPPSMDVQDMEREDILTRWAVFMHYGLLEEVNQSATWFTEFLEEAGKIVSDIEEFKSVLIVFGVAMLNKIMESEKLAFVIPFGDDDE